MNDEAMKRKLLRRTRGRSDAACRRLTALAVQLAAAALFAHILVFAHAVSHHPQGSPDDPSQQCALCTVANHSVGVPTAVIASCQCAGTWVVKRVSRPAARLPDVEQTALARGPPFSILATIG